MNFKKAYEALLKNKAFESWTDQKNCFLTHAFIMIGVDEWQFGFYNSKKKLVTTFFVSDTIKKGIEDQILKGKEEASEIDINKINITYDFALNKARKLLKQKENGVITKEFIVLQNSRTTGQFWNVTLMTETLKVGNFKFNSEDGNLISKEVLSVFEFKAKE